MSAQAWPALGTTIGVDESYPPGGTYTLIGQVKSIGNAGGGEVGERDTTVLTSGVKTFMPTIPDNGTVAIEVNADPTDSVHKFLAAAKDVPPTGSGASYLGTNNFKVTFATGATTSTKVFPGFVKTLDGFTADGPDENLSGSFGIRVAGAYTSVP